MSFFRINSTVLHLCVHKSESEEHKAEKIIVSKRNRQPAAVICSRCRRVCSAITRMPIRTAAPASSARTTNAPPPSTSPAPKSPESS